MQFPDGAIKTTPQSVNKVSLHWAAPPKVALVVRKPNDLEVKDKFVEAVRLLKERGIKIFVEPAVIADALQAGSVMPPPAPSASASVPAGTEPPPDAYQTSPRGGAGSFQRRASSDATGAVNRLPADVMAVLNTYDADEAPTLHERIDFTVALGGDGTLLWAANLFPHSSVPPIVAFAMGSLGFLTPFDISEMAKQIDRTIQGDFELTLRSRLTCQVVRHEDRRRLRSVLGSKRRRRSDAGTGAALPIPTLQQLHEWREKQAEGDMEPELVRSALNEICVSRPPDGSIVDVDVHVDGVRVTKLLADGLLLATPTGSTAYSMSAGGSMVHPAVPCMLFTPICPHSLSARPMAFPDSSTLAIEVADTARCEAVALFDGKQAVTLRRGDAIVVEISTQPVPTVAGLGESEDWFEVVTGLLMWNQRAAQKPWQPPEDEDADADGDAASAGAAAEG